MAVIDFRDVFSTVPNRVHAGRGRLKGQECEVPVFVSQEHYAGNFGKQWTRFRDTQLDSVNGSSLSREFLEQLLNGPLDTLSGKRILEVGAGAGRFTEYLVQYGDQVVALDLSEAIFENAALGAENLVAAQADLFQMPQMKTEFDLVYCRGVLQHTPDPPKAIELIHSLVAPGGMVVFDIYGPSRLGKLAPKYVWRPVIQRLFTFDSFSRFLDRYAARMLRTRWRIKPVLPGKTKRLLDYALPVWDWREHFPISDDLLIEWGILDTLDAMFAKYDNPMRYRDIVRVLDRIGAQIKWSDPGMNFFNTRVPG